MDKIYQGHVSPDESTKIVCTGTSMIVKSIIINNVDTAYTIIVNRFMTGPGIHRILLYDFLLDAGDTVRDFDEYILYKNNYIELITNVPGTSYCIRTEET